MKKDKHLHILLDEQTYSWLKEKAHQYRKTLGEITRTILFVEMQEDLSFEERKEDAKTKV